MKNLVRTSVCLATLTLAASAAHAQDFYDGVRAPGTVQLDNYITLDGTVTGTFVPKLFTKNFLLATPIGIGESGVDLKGLNIGYIAEDFSENNKAIIATGLFKNGEGRFTNISPQVYFTNMTGSWTIDLLGQAVVNVSGGGTGLRVAATIGYGLNDRWRVGGSAVFERGQRPKFRGNVRYEIAKDHSWWAQAYGDKEGVAFRLAINR